MKIGVFGNINAGKSFVVHKLIELFPTYTVVKIDLMRQQYGDGSTKGEMAAQEHFISAVKKTENVIFEFTGYGEIADKLFKILQDKSIIVLNVKADKKICIDRLSHKDFSLIPYPYKSDISDTIKNLSTVFDKENFIDEFWREKTIKILPIYSNTSIENLHLQQFCK